MLTNNEIAAQAQVKELEQRTATLEQALREVLKAFELVQFDSCSPQVEHLATKAITTISAALNE